MVTGYSTPYVHFTWSKLEDEVKISEPGFCVSGYDMRLLCLGQGKSYITEQLPVIVNMLKGRISINEDILRAVSGVQYDVAQYDSSVTLHAAEDSIAFLCYEKNDNGVYGSVDCNHYEREYFNIHNWSWQNKKEGVFTQKGDPNEILNTYPKIKVADFEINLWYIPPNTNGGIHNHGERRRGDCRNPQFVEWHTQLRGNGWMVKYYSPDEKTEYKRIPMKIGYAHPLFSTLEKGIVQYPWHAYVAGDKGALFVAFEDLKIE